MIPVKRQDRGPQCRVSRTRAGAFHALVPLGRRLHGGCQDLKLALAQKIMELRQQGVTRLAVVADYGIGLYAGEVVNALRQTDADMVLAVYDPATARGDAVDQVMEYVRQRGLPVICAVMDD